MEEEILREILKGCRTRKERLLVKLFPKIFINTYHIARVNIVNAIIEKSMQ